MFSFASDIFVILNELYICFVTGIAKKDIASRSIEKRIEREKYFFIILDELTPKEYKAPSSLSLDNRISVKDIVATNDTGRV